MKNHIKRIVLSSSILTKIMLYFRRLSLKRRNKLNFGKNVVFGFSTICGGRNYFGHNSLMTSSNIGYASYISDNTQIKKTKIGRFSSIGPDVKVVFGKHPSSGFVSTHPAFFSTRKQVGFSFTKEQLFAEFADFKDVEKKYSVIIGNDVWIGAGVMIMDGVQIGDGAIVAAGAVVVKDVEPYTIVGGVPAKIIKYRFTRDQIDFLMKFKWWEKEQEWIKKNSKYFIDIDYFIKSFENEVN